MCPSGVVLFSLKVVIKMGEYLGLAAFFGGSGGLVYVFRVAIPAVVSLISEIRGLLKGVAEYGIPVRMVMDEEQMRSNLNMAKKIILEDGLVDFHEKRRENVNGVHPRV